ncbi:hypothetical protein [Bradyrhizobium macuxiense]|nr:hypothetical protein [Bradyrhizobium macuxiense]
MKIWNTEDLPDREQFAYWREVLCEGIRDAEAGAASRADFAPLSQSRNC